MIAPRITNPASHRPFAADRRTLAGLLHTDIEQTCERIADRAYLLRDGVDGEDDIGTLVIVSGHLAAMQQQLAAMIAELDIHAWRDLP